jgi:hypothetical protein
VARIYIWILDGPDNLNLDLVREGFISASSLMTNLRFEDLYVTAKQVWDLRRQAAAAEIEAAKASKKNRRKKMARVYGSESFINWIKEA